MPNLNTQLAHTYLKRALYSSQSTVVTQQAILPTAKMLKDMDFKIVATPGTADALRDAAFEVEAIKKVQHGTPNVLRNHGKWRTQHDLHDTIHQRAAL